MGFLLLNHVEPEVAGKRREPRWVVEVPPGAAELPASLNLGQPDKVALSRPLERERQEAAPSPICYNETNSPRNPVYGCTCFF